VGGGNGGIVCKDGDRGNGKESLGSN
jgi:hypothetical protein